MSRHSGRLIAVVLAIIFVAACQPTSPSATASPTNSTQAQSPPSAIPIPGVIAAGLVVRTGPGPQMEEAAPILGKTADGQWLQVEVRGEAGWIPASQVEVTGSLSSVTIVATPTSAP
jgi:uncharacterized protein YgiM (DUF1202 family)